MFKQLYRTRMRYSFSDRIFLTVNFLLVTVLFIIFLYPLLFILSASFSGSVTTMGASLVPAKLSLSGYQTVFAYKDIWSSYLNSIFYVATGTLISLILTISCAYPLSRDDFKGKGVIITLCMFTMYFQSGMIPIFLTMRNYNLLNTIWAVVLPGALSIYNMIVVRTYFKAQIPKEMLESSQIDGCGNLRFLIRIVIPLSGPIIAVIALFSAVMYWNSYFGPMLFLTERKLYPLSMILREILVLNQQGVMNQTVDVNEMLALQERQHVMKYALIVISSLPVMLLYPFIQKYFVKGVMIGAVKG